MSSAGSIQYLPDPNIDGGWGWIVVGATFLIRVIVDGFVYSFGIFFAEFLRYFQTTTAAASVVMSILFGVVNISGPIASGLINNYGCRVVSFIGTGISCTGLLLSLAVPRVEYLSVTLGLISGFGLGLIYLPTIVGVAVFFEKKRATALGISMAGSGIGSLIFAPLLDWLIKYYHGWKGAFLIVTGIVLHIAVFSFFYKTFTIHSFKRDISTLEDPSTSNDEASSSQKSDKSRRISKGTQTDKKGEQIKGLYTIGRSSIQAQACASAHLTGLMEKSDILYRGNSGNIFQVSRQLQTAPIVPQDVSITDVRSTWSRFIDTVGKMMGLSLLKDYVFLVFFFCTFLNYFGLLAPSFYIFHLALELKVATTSQASFLLSIMGISNTIGKVLFGLWADKATSDVPTLYAGCLLVCGVLTMMVSLMTDYYHLAVYSFVLGLTWGGSISLSTVVLVNLLGMSKLSNAYGLYLLAIGVATITGPPLTGK
ncbi:monocarboxylate transporter 14 [Caerostris darwini]|uniref:Monocarboxylate transporter 14 n=1 Tax=Caerostris darwini TaxID=1538125 RepID=A0AAV4SPY7_9ARAC|nr:monocarboxylate transporter 14 [Caerostris darwini]